MLFSLDSGLPVSTKLPEDHDPERTVCFTGHREKSIQPFEGNPLYHPLTVSAVKLMIYRCIDLAVGQGYNCFISGLATGTDLWAAEYVMKKKLSGKKLSLIGAIPYLRHAERRIPCDCQRFAEYHLRKRQRKRLTVALPRQELLHGG